MSNAASAAPAPYRVLARKYRPSTFAEMIGQDALVRTLTNAIATGRIAQAFILTGVRGVGKTTTARIIARALNCTGPDGNGGPTVSPCGVCDNCKSIAEDRHPDIFEMDAASRTGIGDIREIIEAVRYAPSMARYKVYIIDEVHMLSTAAFNGLLKTLEEPPPHVKFVFATTEIRKVPVTVLSRCQRFDLKRVEISVLTEHFKRIAKQEEAQVDDDALTLIARAAEGSVRDGLSLLDQAIAHGAGQVNAELVRDMLGLADRGQVFALLDLLLHGKLPEALENLQQQYNLGADPAVVMQDLLDLTHWLTRVKVIGGTPDDVTLPETQRNRGKELAAKLGMPVLARTWQMLLKGLQEVRAAPVPLAAAEMVLVRLAYAADLPSPADLVKEWKEKGGGAGPAMTPVSRGGGAAAGNGGGAASAALQTQPAMMPSAQPQPGETVAYAAMPTTFPALVQLARDMREGLLAAELYNDVHVVSFEQGRIEMRLTAQAHHDLPGRLIEKLKQWTGQRWVVSLSKLPGEPTLAEQEQAEESRRRAHAQAHPLVQAVLTAFPGAVLESVRELQPPAPEIEADDDAEGPAYMTDDVDPLDELD
ncbi:DNA polymerase III subunit gamma/tau [uncultured Ferrovibrio sp.]|jgi:DNA polymerase-3 subunit gamma/tau|uniref:DNA polymerase III subunit gamma/tau n=1 Tax=uncultured Ferrovibrio sp. TaxID=1576913 RepID=UPI002625E898|nr:DNA polymerase III subunit gamma/tau [uncultured Ferrovibrio sp.]